MGGTINVIMYLNEDDRKVYIKDKVEINKLTREAFKKEIEKRKKGVEK